MTTEQPSDIEKPAKILVVYGTRPELIKLAPVIFSLRSRQQDFSVTVCSTAQHKEMLEQVEDLFGIESDINLSLMRENQRLNDLSSRVLVSMDRVLRETSPDWAIVQGDTTTVMATALSAFQLGVRIGHVEAGLRTGDLKAPFPEEGNRRIADALSDLHFAPTLKAQQNLLAEGCDASSVFLTGNTVIDSLLWISESQSPEPSAEEVLITVHRRESFGQPILDIFTAIGKLADQFPLVTWIYPVHRNPNVFRPAHDHLGGRSNVILCDPLPYSDLVRHMRRARIVLTDSGGIQEEAPTFSKPVIVLREKTERPEGVEAGVARLVGTDPASIIEQVSLLLTDESQYRRMALGVNPYGDGKAADRIVDILAGKKVAAFDFRNQSPGKP